MANLSSTLDGKSWIRQTIKPANSRPSVADFLQRSHNQLEAGIWSARPLLSELKAKGITPSTIVIVTCCDVRCFPSEFLQVRSSEALILRNIGGHVVPFLPDIATLDAVIGLTEVMVIHHTDCGATHYTDSMIRDVVNSREPGAIDSSATFGAITDLEQSLKDNVAAARASSLIRRELKDNLHGYIFDIQTGEVRHVDGTGQGTHCRPEGLSNAPKRTHSHFISRALGRLHQLTTSRKPSLGAMVAQTE